MNASPEPDAFTPMSSPQAPASSAGMGLDLRLDTQDLGRLLTMALQSTLGTGAFAGLRVAVAQDTLEIHVSQVKLLALAPNSTAMKVISWIKDRCDVVINVTASRRSDSALTLTWSSGNTVLQAAQWTGLIRALVPWSSALREVSRHAFDLHLDHLLGSLARFGQTWRLTSLTAPSTCGAAIHATALPIIPFRD